MTEQDSCGKHVLDRRKFLESSLTAAAMLAATSRGVALSAPERDTQGRQYGAFLELPPGAVTPEGWLGVYLRKQLSELGSHLPEISWPFTEAYWSGSEQGESWWPWEQKAYWVDGATRLALVTQNQALLQKVQAIVNYTLQHQGSNGYLGPKMFEDPNGDEHRWPQTVFFRSLTATADAHVGAPEIAAAMRRHYLNDKADYGVSERNITNVESILWCYGHTGDPGLLAMAENAWSRYLTKAAGDPDHGDLSSQRVFADTAVRAHGVTYAETVKVPAVLYMYTGDAKYLTFAQAAQRRIFDHHMLVDGIPSTTEWFRTRTALDSHETCDIVDHTWAWGYMLQATGDGVWGDHIERACFNAAPGAIKNDWKALQYFSCPNQFVATLNSDHNVMEHGGYMMAYQPNPGKATACCGGNVHRLFPNYVSRMWMRDGNGGLVAVLYGPSTLKTTVGRNNIPVEIEQMTGYPFEETITLRFKSQQPVKFPLSFRVPSWCQAPTLQVNGTSTPVKKIKGFVTLAREFKPGDTLVITLPMRLALSHWPGNGVALEHGPLVYSLPIQEEWTSVVEPRYSTDSFPSWNAKPTSPWNYGLALSGKPLESQVTVQRSPVGDDPWSHPPVRLTVTAYKIEGYALQDKTNRDGQQFTPPLPDLTNNTVTPQVEQITLVPYGATHLRVTIFPYVQVAG